MERLDHVPQRLGHLVLAPQQEAVDGHPSRHLDVRRHQHGRPDHGVELEDVLADEVDRGRPETLAQVLPGTRVGERGVVVEQCIDPDVDHLGRIPGDGHTPLQPGPAERYVAQPTLDEGKRLVVAVLGEHEVRALGVEALQRLLEGRQPKEPVVLALLLELDLVDRATIALVQLRLGLEVGAARAVPAFVGALVHVTVVVDPLHDLGHDLRVLGIGRADEEVVGHVQPGRQLAEAPGVFVAELARRDPQPLGGLGHRLAVLVGPREKEDVLTALAHMAREHVRGDRRVGMAQVGLAVHVVDGRRDVVRHRTSDATRAKPRRFGAARHVSAHECQ